MHLKNLTLKGFKSFADTASIDLEPGVTVVVGPNGSGKSNVVDAIAWVLGAQAPSAVRSGKMDDVIFAGSQNKSALGRAEVSLTIDNHSRTLPVEFSEVKITRTLFRSGDSEYALNGVPCRLLDITELLSDGGVGRQQHVIVSQGQIDAVLNARPEDRRAIIEEAAGVLKFRKRKDRAERRLTATDGDLTRVKDLSARCAAVSASGKAGRGSASSWRSHRGTHGAPSPSRWARCRRSAHTTRRQQRTPHCEDRAGAGHPSRTRRPPRLGVSRRTSARRPRWRRSRRHARAPGIDEPARARVLGGARRTTPRRRA